MRASDLGRIGEDITAEEYRRRGYKIIGRNVRLTAYKQLGELDLIVQRGDGLVFVEVKARTTGDFMAPEESVGFRKQGRLLKAIKAYIGSHPEYQKFNARVDVAIVQPALDPHTQFKLDPEGKSSKLNQVKGGLGVGVDGKLYSVNILEDVIQDST